nr:peptidoglycan recognition family protein [Micromonospora sp. DSM 115978]
MRWTDIARWVGPTPNQGGRLTRHDGVVLHIAAGTYEGTIAWQRNPAARVSSHFVVSKSGEIAQMVDTDVIAWTQRDGNSAWLSIENAGFLPDALTPQQVEAAAQILARAHREYGVPLQVTGTPARRGLGHHSMGAESDYDWGHNQCPGAAIKAQKPAIVARAIQIVDGQGTEMELTDRLKNGKTVNEGISDTADRVYIMVNNQLPAIANAIAALATAVGEIEGVDRAELAAALAAERPALIAGVLAGLPAEEIAAAIPTDLAARVADELGERLAS